MIVEDGCGAARQALHDATCASCARLLGRVATSGDLLRALGAERA
jgi:hypothetical protein